MFGLSPYLAVAGKNICRSEDEPFATLGSGKITFLFLLLHPHWEQEAPSEATRSRAVLPFHTPMIRWRKNWRKKILFVKSYSLEFFQWNTKILQEQMFQQVLSAAKADSCWGCYLTTPKAQGESLEHWKPCKWDSSRREAVMESHRKDKDKCIFMTFQRLA